MNTELIKKYYDAAPENVQAVIRDVVNKPETISSIAAKNGINPDDAAALQIEVLLILLGLETVGNFRPNLMKRLGISYNQALKVTSDVNSNFLDPVLETLKKLEQGISEGPDQIILEKDDSAVKALLGDDNVSETQVPESTPSKLIPDHEEMEKIDGPHVHAQTVMPTPQEIKPEAKPTNGFGSFIPPIKKTFGSIVDQKLSRIVTSNESSTNSAQTPEQKPPTPPKDPYKGKDPYREPIE